MSWTAGTEVSGYEIKRLLGAGGMGEVYLARNVRLQRDVALKVLPPSLLKDPERCSRFEREARVLAALSHPNIAAIHGIEDMPGGGTHAGPGARVRGGSEPRGSHRRPDGFRSKKRCQSRCRKPKPSRPRTTAASSIAT
jgi:hypothetical protein